MMRKILIGFVLLGCFTAAALSQVAPDVIWTRTYGGSASDRCHSMIRLTDGSYLLVGETYSYGSGPRDSYAVKVDENGNSTWSQAYGTSSYELFTHAIELSDGGIFYSGFTHTWSTVTDGWALRVDADGDTVWSNVYSSIHEDRIYGAILDSDNNFVITGFTEERGAGNSDWWLIKIDSLGNTITQRTYSGPAGEWNREVIEVPGGYLMAGFTYSFGYAGCSGWILKTNMNGDSLWSNTFGGSTGPHGDGFNDIIPTSDGAYVAIGHLESSGAGGTDFWLQKISADGDSLWSRSYGGIEDEVCHHVLEMPDHGFLMVGRTESYGAGQNDLWLIRTDHLGNVRWTKTIGGSGDDVGRTIIIDETGSILIGGSTSSNGAGSDDFWLVKLEPEPPTIGHVTLVSPGPPDWTYNLNWNSGAITSFTFKDFCPGTTGSVIGDAATVGWTATNYADSVVFSSPVPLTSGSIEGFVLSHPWCSDQISWIVGDSTGSVDGPLPVELMSFEATPIGNAIRISFSTASESDNDYFEIWRSESDAGTFERTATLPSQGNTASGHNYHYIDENVTAGKTYWYYLTDVDINGSRTEHREMMVSASVPISTIPTEYSLTAYPNPFNPNTTLEFTLPEAGDVNLNVYDIVGRAVAELTSGPQNAGVHTIEFDASSLPSGIYMARLETAEISVTRKLLLVK